MASLIPTMSPAEKVCNRSLATNNFISLQYCPTDGEMVAVICPKYKDRPLIGKVTEVEDRRFTVGWYVGTYSGVWKPWKGRAQGKSINYTDVLQTEDIIFRNIVFTKAMRLPPATVLALKSAYSV